METAIECSQLIVENKEKIISAWENEVRQQVIGAGMSSTLALRNQLADLLDDIAEILLEKHANGFDAKDEYQRTVEKNKHHGKLRAETENYTIDQVIREYFILHRVIAELLQKNEVLSVNISNLLNYLFEITIMHSSSSFSNAIQETQDKLVGMLAHDLRNPLTTALSAVELMEQNANGNEKFIKLAKRSIRRSISLAEGMLDNISVKSGEGMMMNFAEADYRKIIREACKEAASAKNGNIVCEVPDDPVIGIMDKTAVRRLMDNLILNAVKYGDPSSRIKVSLEENEYEIILLVNNQGKSISPEKQKSIFDFLTQSNGEEISSEKSWGMGLALVKTIADAHMGSIHLTSNDEEGTTFRISFKRFLGYSGKVRMKL